MSVDIRHPLKKLIPILLKAKEENLNEADTVQRLMMVFQDALGYDPLTEITREMPIKTKYVDLALKIDGVIKLLVEAKAAGSDPQFGACCAIQRTGELLAMAKPNSGPDNVSRARSVNGKLCPVATWVAMSGHARSGLRSRYPLW